jgi:glycosyltransferase involved in cell wall biosynthesis
MLTAALLDGAEWQVTILAGPQTGSEGSLIETIQKRDLALILEPMLVREINPIKDLRALWRLRQMMRQNQYTIVHTHSSKAGIIGRWAARWAGVPIIVHTVHGWAHHDRQHPLVRAIYIWLEKITLPITDKLIAVTTLDIEKGLTDGIGQRDNYCVIRSGIELDRFGHPQRPPAETRAALGIPADAPVVGTVTRLSPQKAPWDFVRAAAQIAQSYPACWFVMVGDGPLRAEVEALARELQIADRLVLTGLRRDVPELMAVFDIFALSSLWEGLPRVLPQAMATGLPIVATACDGSAEAIIDGETGYLTPPAEPAKLAERIAQLLADPARAAQMGAAGRVRVEEFSDRRMVAQITALYHELLAQKVQ